MATASARKRRTAFDADDLLAVIDGRQRAEGSFYKLVDVDRAVGLDLASEPAVDSASMSVAICISTSSPDRIRDVLIPAGCQLDNYRKNPVVLWEHGFSGLSAPIAKSEDQHGNLTVAISDAEVWAKAYFTNRNRESEQFFALIDDGLVRAASVRANPYKTRTTSDDDGQLFVFEEWDLEEWSFVAVGMNPEAVRKTIDGGRIAGSAIAEPILKSLTPYAATRKPQGRGWAAEDSDNPEAIDVAKSTKPANTKVKASKADDEPMDDEDEAEVKADEPTETDAPPADEPPADEVADESQKPLGAQVLAALHGSVAELVGKLESATGPLENVEVKEFASACVGEMQAKLAEIEGMYSAQYGKGLESPKPEEAAAEAEAVKSWLRASTGQRLQLAGYGSRLKALAVAKNLTAEQRATLAGAVKGIGDIVEKARQKPAEEAEPQVDPAVAKSLGEIRGTFDELKKQLDSIRPYRVVG